MISVIVTGGSGFLGKGLIAKAITRTYEQTNEYSRTRVFVEALDRVRARVFPG